MKLLRVRGDLDGQANPPKAEFLVQPAGGGAVLKALCWQVRSLQEAPAASLAFAEHAASFLPLCSPHPMSQP